MRINRIGTLLVLFALSAGVFSDNRASALPVTTHALTQERAKVAASAQHENQPSTCNNYKQTDEAHRCACNMATTCPDADDQGKDIPRQPDTKCSTNCRDDACECISPCDD
jgi:hypothetical protein